MEREYIAVFVLGIAIGIALHRLVIGIVLMRPPDTRCAHCEWERHKKSRHTK